MRFDGERAQFVCDWIEQHCRLYEGDKAGQPLILLDFQRDFLSRLFGWVMWSDDWGQWIRRFRHGAFWASKKVGKSPLCAAVNLYLLIGDGEPGQKVYQAAKNGEQALIAQKHAINMVRQSPDLDLNQGGTCKINNSTHQITHLPSNSVLIILTGDDTRGAKAKEGLNGSVSFDEMHVVDREMYERVERAGISRKEPFILSWSTAGDDPSSIGHERFQYGRQVNSGERNDPHFLHVEYCVPDNITEADIEQDLEYYGRMANPAWGAIVKPSEFRGDWNSSKGNQRKMALFFQYRLNRWIGSASRWLDPIAWAECGEDYTLEDLRGRECYMGLDLSRVRDMTACVFAFPEADEVVRFWPMFWLPEQTAKERDHLFPFMTWGARREDGQPGPLRLTPGGSVDYNVVKSDIRLTVAEYGLDVRAIVFDPKYANELTQALIEGERLGDTVEHGLGCERFEHNQTMTSYTGPSKEFERLIIRRKLRHPRNKVFDWQAGHVEVQTNSQQNIRPVKPAAHSGKAVDGIQAGVMALTLVPSGDTTPTITFI